jgi:hypothetical protein
MCDCERIKLQLLKELEREAVIKKGEAWIPMNAILNRIYKIQDLSVSYTGTSYVPEGVSEIKI